MKVDNVIENCLKAINKAKRLKNLNMFVTDTHDLALKQAEKSHERIVKQNKPLSKIDGKIVSVKDNFSTESILTTCGSKMLENYIPPYNATVVEKILNAGSPLIGKTNLDEFGMGTVSSSYFGTVKNPFNIIKNKNIDQDNNDFYVSGGSSGGSAASVSSGVADFSIGSDTGGSIRNPAAICGCIGYKPTYGLISRYGLIPLNNYFDTVGIMSRDFNTLVDALNVIAGPDERDATTIKSKFEPIKLEDEFKPDQLVIGVPQEFHPNGLSEENLIAWDKTVEMFSKLSNCKIVQVSIPHSIYSMSVYTILTSCEVASNFARYDGLKYGYHTKLSEFKKEDYEFEKVLTRNRDNSLGRTVKGRIVSGNFFLLKDNYETYFLKSHQVKQLIVEDFQKVFNSLKVDLLITPALFHDTPTYEEHLKQQQVFDEKDFFTCSANIAGLPAISVPAKLSKNQLPVGVQFIANWNKDKLLINAANWFTKNNLNNYSYLNYNF